MSKSSGLKPALRSAIRRAGVHEREPVSRLLGEAFMDDPVSAWVFPDESHRREVHPRFFGVFLDAALRDGWVDVTEDISAAALWIPVGPGGGGAEGGGGSAGTDRGRDTVGEGTAGMVGADAERTDGGGGRGQGVGHDGTSALMAAADPGNERTGIVGGLTALAHPQDRFHYYLPSIVVAADRRGQGLGAALLGATLERCDREGVCAYLEASSTRSRALYERHGFVFTGTTVDLPGGPPMWPMWREPGGSAVVGSAGRGGPAS